MSSHPANAPIAFHLMEKPAGAVCNLDCDYYLCLSYKDVFHHVDEPMQTMARLLAGNRAPAEIIDVYAPADASRARNEPA
jgi:sulfatase maturation enzyme AslB (radical SAM superfamily)